MHRQSIWKAAACILALGLCFQQPCLTIMANEIADSAQTDEEPAPLDEEGPSLEEEEIQEAEEKVVSDSEEDAGGENNKEDADDAAGSAATDESDNKEVDSEDGSAPAEEETQSAEETEAPVEEAADDQQNPAAVPGQEEAADDQQNPPIVPGQVEATQDYAEVTQEMVSEHIDLLQEGAYVTEHFGVRRRGLLRTDQGAALKQCISKAMDEGETEVDISEFGLTIENDKEKLGEIFHSCVQEDHFYVSGAYSYYYIPDTGLITLLVLYYAEDYCDSEGNPDLEKIKSDRAAFLEKADEMIQYASQGRNTLEQVLLAHDWLARECTYDYQNYLDGTIPDASYSAFGCLVNQTAVCQGYSLAYAYVLQKMGIENFVLSSDSMNHAWNYINLDGNWLHADVTWDDPVYDSGNTALGFYNEDYADLGFVDHTYFLKSDGEFEERSHSGWIRQADGASVPSSAEGGMYENAIFCDSSLTAFNYLDGLFYYTDADAGFCASDDLWGSGMQVIDTGLGEVYYPHMGDHCILFTDCHSIYAYAPEAGIQQIIDGEGRTISEMVTAGGSFHYVTLDGEETETHVCAIPGISVPLPVYTINASAGEGGTISPDGDTQIEEGNSQKYTMKANEGYEIKDVLVDGVSQGAVASYTFEDIRSDHTIEAVFQKKAVQTFKDVPPSYAFYKEIEWASANKIVSGYDDGTFRPQGECKRKQIVAFLWRLKGTPAPASLEPRFKDVNTKTSFYKAIYWASENNIVLGFGDKTFRPDDTCTRGQVVAFLWRIAGRPSPKTTNGKFSDVPKANSFYKAILWASENGIVKGYSDGTFRPDQNCTRGQIVTFIYRYVNLKR